MLFVPPQHGKSELSTRRFPAFALGLNPNLKIAICSYSATIASNFNRDIQRIIDDPIYETIFPSTSLNENSAINPSKNTFLRNSETFEIIGHTGFVKTVGVGGSLTGTPVDIGIIDDPFKDRQEAMSGTIREKVWSWFTDVFETRLHNDSQQLVIMCMVGNTPVLMSDWTEKNLKDIQIGDSISTYDNGKLSSTKVLNWKNQGLDFVYEIRMRSGILVKANERHPFLVCKNGITEWRRLKNLKPGDEILRVTQSGGHTKASRAATMDVINQQDVRDIATPITIKQDGHQGLDQNHQPQNQDERIVYATDMALAWRNSMLFLKIKMAGVLFAVNCLLKRTLVPIGMVNFALTTATKQVRSEGYYATTATSLLDTEKLSKSCLKQQNIYDFIPDVIEEIVYAGREDVFDIQVERTENFIANGLVSHNTRWDEDDLAGRILKRDKDWEVIRFPAIKKRESPDDPRQIGEVLWPEKHSLERITRVEETTPVTFSSLYQQEPSAPKDLLIFPEWVEIDEMPDYTQYFGGDFGYPTAICEVKWHGKNLYLNEVMYDETDPTNSQITANVKTLGYNLTRPFVWDNAEPRSIKDLKTNKENPMNAIDAIKGQDSISYGINTIKEFKIHVTKDSHNLKRELNHYQWMTHKGKKTDQPIDEFNHLIDCIRYVLSRFYKAPSKSSGLNLSFHR